MKAKEGLNIVKKIIHFPNSESEIVEYNAIYEQVNKAFDVNFNSLGEIISIGLCYNIHLSVIQNAVDAIEQFLKEQK